MITDVVNEGESGVLNEPKLGDSCEYSGHFVNEIISANGVFLNKLPG